MTRCDICGRELTMGRADAQNPDGYIYSPHTGAHFCPLRDWKTCVRPEEKEEAA